MENHLQNIPVTPNLEHWLIQGIDHSVHNYVKNIDCWMFSSHL